MKIHYKNFIIRNSWLWVIFFFYFNTSIIKQTWWWGQVKTMAEIFILKVTEVILISLKKQEIKSKNLNMFI